MTKVLFVGDVHAVPSELSECKDLMDFISKTAIKEKPDSIVFLGDIFHTHAVVRIEVLDFWIKSFNILALDTNIPIISLVGNHDMPGSKAMEEQKIHALECLKDIITVVDTPGIYDGVGMIPYTHSPVKLIEWSKQLYKDGAVNTLVCHQTFDGVMYGGNMLAPDGVDQNLLPQKYIISGHIHKKQQIGKVNYIGSPRWRTKADANDQKYISLFTFSGHGKVSEQKTFSTWDICRPIVEYEYKEGEEWTHKLSDKCRNFVTLVGTAKWINKTKRTFEGMAEIRSKIINEKRSENRVRESEGIEAGMRRFIFENFEPAPGITKEEIWNNLI